MEAIANFLSLGEAYCSVSWGKDSTVVAHLVLTQFRHVPVAYVKANRANPDSDLVQQAFMDVHRVPTDIFPVMLHSLDQGETINGFFDGVAKHLGKRRIMGIRAQESASRRLSAKVHGISTALVCRPILDWTIDDVFAYLLWRELPIHPVYAMSNAGQYDRKELRVDVLGDVRGTERGRKEWEWMYYPEETRQHQQEIERAINHT